MIDVLILLGIIVFAKNFNELHTYSVISNLLNKWEIKEK